MLAANVIETRFAELLAAPFAILDAAGMRVGTIGLAYPNTPLTTAASNVAARLMEEARAPWREQLGAHIAEARGPLVRAQTLAGQEPRRRDEE